MPTKAKRIYELARELSLSSNALLAMLGELGFGPKSHMSVATDEMTKAVDKKLSEEKQEVKKEMQHRSETKEAVMRKTAAAGPGARAADVSSAKPSPIGALMRKFEKKSKRKDRRKKKDRRTVDQAAVAKSFKSTMADLSGVRTKKKYRKGGGAVDADGDNGGNVLRVSEFMSVAELAKLMDEKPATVITKLFELGMVATINQRLDMDSLEMAAGEFGFEVAQVADVAEYAIEQESQENLVHRAPVVTIMGHVDHGKTSLLDYVRDTDVVAGEAGAITQHIGASEVQTANGRITFLDTPGHEAFTAMRARGAHITDIVVLVVAADDGVRPQTVEAIDHARAANVPIVVAINKIDKPNANIDSIRSQLSKHSLLSEEWGGNTIIVEVSAKTGEGVDKLLEMILLQAEMMDLRADGTIRAQGVVIDAHLDKGRGPVATVLIQRGTTQVGDTVVAGTFFGRIRTILSDREGRLESIGPSMPAQITGLNGVPQAGDSFLHVGSDQEAKAISSRRSQLKREHDSRQPTGAVSLDKVFERIKEGQVKELRLIIKGDVDGSVEVLADTLGKIITDEVRTEIIHRGVGAITESDVLLAAASKAIIIGFQVTTDVRSRELAKREQVDIRSYDIIYEAESEVKKALEGMLSPELSEKYIGTIEVRDLFRVPKIGVVAGSYVKDGKISRGDNVRLSREGKVIYTGVLSSLRRFKDDVKEVKEGFECGIGIESYNDIKVGDIIEAYEIIETARTL